jgi:sorbitol/mannitol transport system permease protein
MAAFFPQAEKPTMATRQTQLLARTLLTPAVGLLFIWMIVPLALTIYLSTLH